jgi:heavy metal translocating P-type ATPase
VIKKTVKTLGGIPMTIVSGTFLAVSLILTLTNTPVFFDPAWATVTLSGIPLVYIAVTELFIQKAITTELLISIAMAASIAIGELFAAGEVAFIMMIGAILENFTINRAKKGIGKLVSLVPQQARRIEADASETTIPIDLVAIGDLLRVLPGETIPVDGVIESGNTSVDQSLMTGEALPVDKGAGDGVFCGTMNRFGSIAIRATNVGGDSSLQKMIRLVREAENNKAPMQRTVDRWASWLVPVALAIAALTYLFTHDVVRAVTVLVVFCPCALALATPTSVMAAIGQATKHGVLIKSGEALENMGKVTRVAFDKTGTLTLGDLRVSDALAFLETTSQKELMDLAACAEKRSEHPLGKAILAHADALGIEAADPEDFVMEPGKGVNVMADGSKILCGSSAFLAGHGVVLGVEGQKTVDLLRGQGKASVIVAKDGVAVGVIALSDTMRTNAPDMVAALRKMDTYIVLLTGDHKQGAEHFAKQAGINDIRSELLPAQKVAAIRKMQDDGEFVAMIGDGVNDAPALKAANVGIAMGKLGSDIAVEAADIALMGDDLMKIPYLKRLSVATLRTIRGNIIASMAINFVAIGLSVLGLMGPVTGALVHNAGSVLVVLNAALLYDRKFAA